MVLITSYINQYLLKNLNRKKVVCMQIRMKNLALSFNRSLSIWSIYVSVYTSLKTLSVEKFDYSYGRRHHPTIFRDVESVPFSYFKTYKSLLKTTTTVHLYFLCLLLLRIIYQNIGNHKLTYKWYMVYFLF